MRSSLLRGTTYSKHFRDVELFIKGIVCPRGKNFWCDSKKWQVCYCCGAIRYMLRTGVVFNPRNYSWKVYDLTHFYIITRKTVTQYPIARMIKKAKPCSEQLPCSTFK